MKGQAALEYMIVIGIALLVSAPFLTQAQSSIVEIRSSVGTIQAQDSLNDLDVAIRTVNAAGEPATRTIRARFPENMKSAQVNNNSISVVLNTDTGTRKILRTYESRLTGSLPNQGGLYFIRVKAIDGEVEVKDVS